MRSRGPAHRAWVILAGPVECSFQKMPRATQVSKSRDYVFTLNNYNDGDEDRLKQDNVSIDFITYGKEVGTMGTKHLQGFVQFKHPVSLRRCKDIIGTSSHVETRRGRVRDAILYCEKDGEVYRRGTPQRLQTSAESQQEKWKIILKLAEESRLDQIKEEYPSYYIRYFNIFRSLSTGTNDIIQNLENEWWYGPTGTGKSYTLWNQYPNHYQKELNKWWDNYLGEEVVAIEEWCPKNDVTASSLKIWADRYPFTGQIKGGTLKKIRPKKIIVLSNYSIEQCFQNEEDRGPIKRRFKEVYYALPFVPVRGLLAPCAPAAPPSSPRATYEGDGQLDENILNLDFLNNLLN